MNVDITDNLDEIMEAGAELEAAREAYEEAKARFRALMRGGRTPEPAAKPSPKKKTFKRGVAKRNEAGLSISQRALAYVAGHPGCRAPEVVAAVGKEDEAAIRSALKKHASVGRLANHEGQWYPGNELAKPDGGFYEAEYARVEAEKKSPATGQGSGEQLGIPGVTAPGA